MRLSFIIRDAGHLAFIRSLPCIVCAREPSQAAHVRVGGTDGKGGVGMKPGDNRTVPLCHDHHAEQHSVGERTFWERLDIDPLMLANELFSATGDDHQGREIVHQTRWNSNA